MVSKLISLSIVFSLCTSCANVVILNNSAIPVLKPDPLRFPNPICIKLDFKTDNIGEFNQSEGLQPMDMRYFLTVTSGLPYYNISIDCAVPVASYTVVYSSQTRNLWLKYSWAFVSFVSFTIIPFYINETGNITIYEKEQVVAKTDYEEKRLSTIFLLPRYYRETIESVRTYRVSAQNAHESRILASLIRSSLEKKNPALLK